jgi:hypothetical protein
MVYFAWLPIAVIILYIPETNHLPEGFCCMERRSLSRGEREGRSGGSRTGSQEGQETGKKVFVDLITRKSVFSPVHRFTFTNHLYTQSQAKLSFTNPI